MEIAMRWVDCVATLEFSQRVLIFLTSSKDTLHSLSPIPTPPFSLTLQQSHYSPRWKIFHNPLVPMVGLLTLLLSRTMGMIIVAEGCRTKHICILDILEPAFALILQKQLHFGVSFSQIGRSILIFRHHSVDRIYNCDGQLCPTGSSSAVKAIYKEFNTEANHLFYPPV